ncbi:MAG: hypothetical protein ACRD28_11320 [Acidobacteriaceae bacterium]
MTSSFRVKHTNGGDAWLPTCDPEAPDKRRSPYTNAHRVFVHFSVCRFTAPGKREIWFAARAIG